MMSADQQKEQEQEEGDEDGILLSLIGYDRIDGLETKIAQALDLVSAEDQDLVSIVEVEQDRVLFVVYNNGSNSERGNHPSTAEEMVKILNDAGHGWLCSVAEMEEDVIIDEEEAYRMWQNMNQDSRTCHLPPVPNPDGEMIQPKHFDINTITIKNDDDGKDSITGRMEDQLKRDPMLSELDNVARIDISQLSQQANWEEPIVITGCLSSSKQTNDNKQQILSRDQLMERLGQVIVRTGNRNTLVESGFDNSTPLQLKMALEQKEGCIIFTPVKELPTKFQQDLASLLLTTFPCFPSHTADNRNDNNNIGHQLQQQKYTLCVANQIGFGIGMHKHNEAYFLLTHGKKKWYMSPPTYPSEPTHPGFYTIKSTHKSIQKVGELLYVPDQWYHEIFNLSEYTAGIQALPD